MAQPVWVTPAGNLGTIPENVFYQVPLEAYDPDAGTIYFKVIAGELPVGVSVDPVSGIMVGVPKAIAVVEGVPYPVVTDTTSRFVVRAYTTKVVSGVTVVDRLADRTFTLTVTGPGAPEFITPSGQIAQYLDGTQISNLQIEYTNVDNNPSVIVKLAAGQLPPGLTISPNGVISGFIAPNTGGTGVPAGFSRDDQGYSQYPFDFSTVSVDTTYEFVLEVTDGATSNLRSFSIKVYAHNDLLSSSTQLTADNTFILASASPVRTPILLNPQGSIGTVTNDNFYAYKFDGLDFDGDPITYTISVTSNIGFSSGTVNFAPGSFDYPGEGFDQGSFSLPPGLTLDPNSGWLYGYIPNTGVTEASYNFAIRVYKSGDPTIISNYYYYSMTIVGAVNTAVTWITPSDLGYIANGATSDLAVEAVSAAGTPLQYRLVSGSNSSLPQGLQLLSSGLIAGRVSFDTFALDGGTTTFDRTLHRGILAPTTFDMKHTFKVNAYASSNTPGYSVSNLQMYNTGSGYVSAPTVIISPPPNVAGAIPATAGAITIVNGQITNIAVGNPGAGYQSPPTITITGGGGADAVALAVMEQSSGLNSISVFKTFSITVVREYNEPYENLYIQAMPPQDDRILLNGLLQNTDVFIPSLIYRADDPNFGVASRVIYQHAFGLTSSTKAEYYAAIDINHYWKNLTLGNIEVAQALDSSGNVMYDVVYSRVIDNLVNNQGVSVNKQVSLAYPVENGTVRVVYPNSLVDMRTQVIDSVGQVANVLPRWMLSRQANGQVLGFTPAWVVAYAKPGKGAQIAYNIEQYFGNNLNIIDFTVDRYEVDALLSKYWDPVTQSWIPNPPEQTVFDVPPVTAGPETVFDGGSVQFVAPSDMYTNTTEFDKYIVFPKRTILG